MTPPLKSHYNASMHDAAVVYILRLERIRGRRGFTTNLLPTCHDAGVPIFLFFWRSCWCLAAWSHQTSQDCKPASLQMCQDTSGLPHFYKWVMSNRPQESTTGNQRNTRTKLLHCDLRRRKRHKLTWNPHPHIKERRCKEYRLKSTRRRLAPASNWRQIIFFLLCFLARSPWASLIVKLPTGFECWQFCGCA